MSYKISYRNEDGQQETREYHGSRIGAEDRTRELSEKHDSRAVCHEKDDGPYDNHTGKETHVISVGDD